MPYIGKEPEHGNYQLLDALTLPDGVFNGSRTVFNLTADSVAVYPTSPATMIISLGGVLQEPNSSYTVSGNQITFTTAPATSTNFFGVSLGDTLDIGTPSDNSVTVAKMVVNSVDSDQYVDGSIDNAHLANDAVDTQEIADDAVTYAKMQNLGTADRVLGSASTGVIGEVQIVPDMLATNAVTNVKVATGIDAVKLADGSVTNAELQYINTLSSNAQTQLAAKHATIDSSARLDASLIGANGNVSNAEYGYLDGVTSAIQTQINAAGGDFSNGGDNGALVLGTNDSNSLTLETNNTARMVIASAGEITKPAQPCFLTHIGTGTALNNITGDNTEYTIVWNSEVFDQGGPGGNGNLSGSTFTAPVTGKYFMEAQVQLDGVTSSHTEGMFKFVTNNAEYPVYLK